MATECSLVSVAMMDVGVVRVPVRHGGVAMRVAVRFAGRIIRRMGVLVVVIVHVCVSMIE